MLGNDSSEHHPSSSSAAENPVDENLNVSEAGNDKLHEAAYKSIFDELVEDAMWELSFEVHRAAKLGYFFLKVPEKRKSQTIDDTEEDIFGPRLKSNVQNFQISCPICYNKSCATKFALHLAKCIGICGRNSSRAANKKIAASTTYSDDENDYDSDSNYNGSKKRAKKSQPKKSSRRKSKVSGNGFSKSSTDNNANYHEMTYERRKEFFNQKCGVISKRTNKMCMNPHKCSQHSDEQRRDVRHFLLRDMGEQLTNDGQIDVDTVDEGGGEFSFITQSLPACSASSKNMSSSSSGFTGEKKNSSSKSNTAQFKKKRNSESNNSSPGEMLPTSSSFE